MKALALLDTCTVFSLALLQRNSLPVRDNFSHSHCGLSPVVIDMMRDVLSSGANCEPKKTVKTVPDRYLDSITWLKPGESERATATGLLTRWWSCTPFESASHSL